MRKDDFAAFGSMLDAVCSMLSRGTYAPNAENTAMFFRALSRFTLAEVRAGFDAHVADPQRGRFVPVPADIIAQINAATCDDGRPGAEEAWAIALSADDEARTVVWTAETARAWGLARPVLDAGDKVGARMAFKEAYERLVGDARSRNEPTQWAASIGFDPQQREAAIRDAATAGHLPAPPNAPALAAPQALQMLTGSPKVPDHLRERFAALRERLTTAPPGESASERDRAMTEELKAIAAERVANYGKNS